MDSLAPIVLFTYNRPDHTRKTIDALKMNKMAKESQLYVFSDGAKTDRDISNVNNLRSYLKQVSGFKSVNIIERDGNYGLKKSIIEGVTAIISKYGKIIVLEDDVVTSPTFLTYMNSALDHFENNSKVWHISGWTPAINSKGLPNFFFWRIMNCSAGWGTWKSRWDHYSSDLKETMYTFSYTEKMRFSFWGLANFWRQLRANENGKINTWAIYWYAVIYKNNGLCLTPKQSFAKNIGFDGSGMHTNAENAYKTERVLNQESDFDFEKIKVNESKSAINKAYWFYFMEDLTKLLRRIFI
ncbi:glycosyltransferase [Salibacter halophilus]|uniref:Glycosyltransferase n=1 Tax=Salibacter halophilus TaxID=1803916 RepID=A0A6N6M5R2_9FLAO|nr:glycosyltransferase [Salibacter halophilus]KAB1064863.1 glycosyltransferase [Salibacter halophilus]